MFFRSDDGFWWLDTLEGNLSRPWPDAEAMNADLGTPDGQDQYLLAGLAWSAERHGIVPTVDQVYGFKAPPVLGGPLEVDNVEVIDFVVSLTIAGQIHQRIRDLPPGTRIAGFTVDGQSPHG